MARVFISDAMSEAGINLLRSYGVALDIRQGLSSSALEKALRESDAAFVRSTTRITADVLRDPGKLRLIVRGGVGTDNIDIDAASRRGIRVVTTPNSSTISVAEHTVGMIISVVRHIVAADSATRRGLWERHRWQGTQLAGKSLGIVGLGRIGREVARRAAAFDMKIIAFDPFVSTSQAVHHGVETVPDLDSLLSRCDILTLHTPLTTATTNLIGARELGVLRKGSRVVNCARGGIINEDALADALRSGHLGGAAIDVFVTEPIRIDHPLMDLPNVILTPHLGASTNEAQVSISIEAAHLLVEFVVDGKSWPDAMHAAPDGLELSDSSVAG